MMTPQELRVWRKTRGLTQVGLVRQVGVASNTVSRWERGDPAPPPLLDAPLRGLRMVSDLPRPRMRPARPRRHFRPCCALRVSLSF
ncbi:MAG: helix-turn-helix domain-containing protein [Anaerolineaceae bacterium]|nr:helix-turn-helix domain-containing protein [Anaerolineaceae bacterium]